MSDPAVASGRMCGQPQPVIEVDELILRPFEAADVEPLVAAFEDPGIQRWHVRTMTAAEAVEWIERGHERWRIETGAEWAVIREGVLAGRMGIHGVDLEEGYGEAAYWVLPGARGLGVAPRALAGMSRWLFANVGLQRIELDHSLLNPASCRVAEKAGFVAEGIKRGSVLHADGWHDMHLHALLRTDVET